jgi:AcrR family transcriptional regulator
MKRTDPYHCSVPEQRASPPARRPRLARAERERIVLDTAARLFYARGVHEVGMDELVGATGLGKATVYRLFATKDALVGAYLDRLARTILAAIDAQAEAAPTPRVALLAVLGAVAADLARPEFRGCAFNNASIEFADPQHVARAAARDYRAALHVRLRALAGAALPSRPAEADALAGQLATLIDGAYTSAAHLGPDGPAAAGLALARALVAATDPDTADERGAR